MDTGINPENWEKVESVVSCDICKDGGLLYPKGGGVYFCDCKRSERIKAHGLKLPPNNRDAVFLSAKGERGVGLYIGGKYAGPILPEELRWLKDMEAALNNGAGIYYVGNNGTGKTTRAAALIRNYINKFWREDKRSIKVEFFTDSTLISKIRDEDLGGDIVSPRLRNADILVVDDFGRAKATEYTDEQLFKLVDFRYKFRRTTIVTTNYPESYIKDKYPSGAGMISRFMERNEVVELTGIDYRRANAPDNI